MLYEGGEEWGQHLLFRDYLRANEDVAARYAELKEELARRFRYVPEGYVSHKSEFIKQVLERARECARVEIEGATQPRES